MVKKDKMEEEYEKRKAEFELCVLDKQNPNSVNSRYLCWLPEYDEQKDYNIKK